MSEKQKLEHKIQIKKLEIKKIDKLDKLAGKVAILICVLLLILSLVISLMRTI